MTLRVRWMVMTAAGVAALAAVCGAMAQQSAPFRASVEAQWVVATAVDKDGHLVTDLKADDFQVTDRGAPRDVTTFRNDPIPFALTVLFDISGSMAANLLMERRALAALTSQFQPGDRAQIGTFADTATISPRFSANADQLSSWVSSTVAGMGVLCRAIPPPMAPWRGGSAQNLVVPAFGGTALWDSLDCAISSVASDAETPRRVVLLVTDGIDNQSVTPPQFVVDDANHFGVMIYCIAMSGEAGAATIELHKAAEETGGGYFFLSHGDDVTPIFARIADELRHQYVFGLSPSSSDPGGKALEIRTRRPDVLVRARRVDFEADSENRVAPSAPLTKSDRAPGAPATANAAPPPAAPAPPRRPPGAKVPPAHEIAGFSGVLDSYRTEPRPVTIEVDGLSSLLVTLKATAPQWVAAAGADEVPRRRLAVATFVLDALLPHQTPELWTADAPAGQLLEWACDFLRSNPSPMTDVHGAERLWDIASIGLLEQLGGSSQAPDTAGSEYQLIPGPTVPATLRYHLAHVEARFPSEPRWAIAEGVGPSLFTWPEWRDKERFAIKPQLMADINSAYDKATQNPAARSEAFVLWGSFELRRGFPAKALEHFKLAGQPSDPTVSYWLHFLSGQAHHALGQPQEEIADYRAALSDAPFAQSASVALGAALLAVHREDEAAAVVTSALTHHTDDPFQLLSDPDWRYVGPALVALRREIVR